MAGKTLYDKLWEMHEVKRRDDGSSLIYIDRHILHEVTSPQAFEGLRLAGRKPWRIDANIATPDHNVPTTRAERQGGLEAIADEVSRIQVQTLDENCDDFGILEFKMNDVRQGIVHVIGPEQGATLPGMTVVCGDSHTSTHGAFGALAHGIGTSEVEHVLATQCLVAKKMKNMQVRVEGKLPFGVTAKDIVLAIIGKIGTAGGNGHAMEFAGSAIRDLSMEGRMTLCNMAIEAGARVGLVAVDDKTIAYVEGRPYAPKGADWDGCRGPLEGSGIRRRCDVRHRGRAEGRRHQAAGQLGHLAGNGAGVDQRVPDPAAEADPVKRGSIVRALQYMGLERQPADHRHQVGPVFIGSCTNSRIEDLRAAAEVAKGRKVAANVKQALVVPGSGLVKQQAEAEGLDKIFIEAGFEWREPGCSMCLAMNAGQAGQRRALRLHLQPQLRRASGRRRPYPPGEPGDGRRRRGDRPLHRRSRTAPGLRTET